MFNKVGPPQALAGNLAGVAGQKLFAVLPPPPAAYLFAMGPRGQALHLL